MEPTVFVSSDGSGRSPYSVRVVKIQRNSDAPLRLKTFTPLTAVLLVGFFLSALLLALSIWQHDGMSIAATILLSFHSSLIGYCNKSTLQLPIRVIRTVKVPRGDIVIRYPNGSFMIVRCDEDVASELYFNIEKWSTSSKMP